MLDLTSITDSLSTGISAALGELAGYAQTHTWPSAIHWSVRRLNKYLFSARITTATGRKPMKFT